VSKGALPVSSSYTRMPSAQMSAPVPYCNIAFSCNPPHTHTHTNQLPTLLLANMHPLNHLAPSHLALTAHLVLLGT
jgi:hypothetical protein